MKYIILESPNSTSLSHSPSPDPGTVSKGIMFAFTYMCLHCLHHIHPPTPFPTTSLLSPVPTSPGRTCSAFLFYDFVEEKA
jgi:hypothetical protein